MPPLASPAPADNGADPVAARLDRLPATRWLWSILALLFLSWFIESYDIGLTGSVLPTWTHLYHLSSTTKAFAAVAANLGIVLGIVPAGRLADRFGRKKVLVTGTAAYAVLTACTALAGGIAAIVVLRVLAGMAMGAVLPLPYVMGSELCPPDRRGRFTGIADSFLSVGYLLSPLLALGLIPDVGNTTGWRIMFAVGGIPVLFAVLAWRYLPESPRWYEAKGRFDDAERVVEAMERRAERQTGQPLPAVPAGAFRTSRRSSPPLREILSPTYRRRSVSLWVTFGGVFFIFYSIQTFMPTVIGDLGFSLTSAFGFTVIIVGVSIPGKLLEAWGVERWGRRPILIGFTLAAAAAAFAFGFTSGAVAVLAVGSVMSFFGIGVDPAVKVYTSESYPTDLRAWGASTTEGIGRLISGVIGPSFIPALLAAAGVASVYVLVGAVAVVAVVVVVLSGRETAGRSLEVASAADPTARASAAA